jgi:signal transduction histidine kinase
VSCIRAGCGLILGIVGNVLTAPEVERGALTLTRDTFSPHAVICDVLQACRLGHAAASAPGGSIVLDESPQEAQEGADADAVTMLPTLLVEADRNRIAQVTQNCVTNSCKFSAGTPVRVRLTLHARGGDDASAGADADEPLAAAHWLTVRVSDGGRGMSAAQAAACFDAGAAAPAAAGGGTGLGLYLSRAFATLMGGTLSVDTRPGEGCAFTLRVPVRVLDARETAVVRAAAESSAAALAAAERELEEEAAATTPAQHTRRGVLKREPGGRRFHVLVADGALRACLLWPCACVLPC